MRKKHEPGAATKHCCRCDTVKPASEFSKDSGRRDGLLYACRSCNNAREKLRRDADIEKYRARQRNWSQKWRESNPEESKKISRASYYRDLEKNRKYAREWQRAVMLDPARLEKRRAYRRKYHQERTQSTPRYKIQRALSGRILSAIRRSRASGKMGQAVDILGCSIAHFMKFLQGKFKPGMTWGNYGKWHIDHIKPCAAFDLNDFEQQRYCFHFTNLRPLWAIDNLQKGARY